MTRVALISSILIGIGSLAWGYSQIGLDAVTRWIIILGVVWLITAWNGVRWFSSFALALVILVSAFGLWFRFAPGWMFSGGIFALVAWDLARFRQRLIFLPAREDKRGMERRHLARRTPHRTINNGEDTRPPRFRCPNSCSLSYRP